MHQRPVVTIRSWVRSRWAGKTGELRARLDAKHVLVDLEEPGLRATEKFHIREVHEEGANR